MVWGWVWGFGFRISGLVWGWVWGFRVWGLGLRVVMIVDQSSAQLNLGLSIWGPSRDRSILVKIGNQMDSNMEQYMESGGGNRSLEKY